MLTKKDKKTEGDKDYSEPTLKIIEALYRIPLENLREGGYNETDLRKASVCGQQTIVDRSDYLVSKKIIVPPEKTKDKFRLTNDFVIGLHIANLEDQINIPMFNGNSEYRDPVGYLSHLVSNDSWKVSVAVPGSALIAGDYGAVVGVPAIVVPIPLYLHLAVGIEESPREVSPQWDFYLSALTPDHEFDELRNNKSLFKRSTELDPNNVPKETLDKFKDKLSELSKKVKKIVIVANSEIPLHTGLGSSGAFSAALALIIDAYKNRNQNYTPPPISQWHAKSASDLNVDPRFFPIFKDAYEFEKSIQHDSSAVGPFASLVGCPDGTPYKYQKEFDDKNTNAVIKIIEFEKLNDVGSDFWNNDIGLATIYTGKPKIRTRDKLQDDRIKDKLKEPSVRKALRYVVDKLWKNIGDQEVVDIVTSINLYAGYEKGFFKIMLGSDEDVVRKLCGYCLSKNLGTKYSGAGDGGDLIVIGDKDELKGSLIPNYFPVNSANFIFKEGKYNALAKVDLVSKSH